MPSRLTVDENGLVVSVQSIPGVKTIDTPTKVKPKTKPRKSNKSRSITSSRSRSAGYFAKPGYPGSAKRTDISSWTTCPVCEVKVLEKNLGKHKRKVHGIAASHRSAPEQATSKRKGTSNVKKAKKRKPLLPSSAGGRRSKTGRPSDLHEQGLRQSFEDQQFAGKGLGHFQREQGRFGSLPLYDDYGEESDA